MTNVALSSVFAETSVMRYMQQIKQFPILSQEEESELVETWLKKADIKAAHQLVTSHLRLVVKIALKFRSYGLPMMDVISEGNIGLMKAVKKFKPEKGNRLSTYAMWWIKACIQEYIIKSWSMLKISSGTLQKKLFSNAATLSRAPQSDSQVKTISLSSSTFGASISAERAASQQQFLRAISPDSKVCEP